MRLVGGCQDKRIIEVRHGNSISFPVMPEIPTSFDPVPPLESPIRNETYMLERFIDDDGLVYWLGRHESLTLNEAIERLLYD